MTQSLIQFIFLLAALAEITEAVIKLAKIARHRFRRRRGGFAPHSTDSKPNA